MEEENQQQPTPQPEKKEIPKWRYVLTPIFIIVAIIFMYWFSIGREGDEAMSLLIGGAVSFAMVIMWIVMNILNSKSPSAKYIISIRNMVLTGVYSFIFLIVWLIFILVIY